MSRHYFEQYEKIGLEYNGPLFMTKTLSTFSQSKLDDRTANE